MSADVRSSDLARGAGTSWQIRRAELNHDDLPPFISHLDAFMARLTSETPSIQRMHEFLEEDLPRWTSLRDRASTLVDEMVDCVSPSSLFVKPPLSALPDDRRSLLRNIVVALWLERYGSNVRLSGTRQALLRASNDFRDIQGALEACDVESISALRSLESRFRGFKEACLELSSSISGLPHARYLP